jgi:hypothetical protein
MESDFLFFIEDQVAFVGPDAFVARDPSNWTVFTYPCIHAVRLLPVGENVMTAS